MKTKLTSLLAIFLIAALAVCGVANAAITINEVEFDDTELKENSITLLDVEKGEDYEIKVRFVSNEDLKDVQVEAYLRGYDHDDRIEDITDVFDVKKDVTYTKKLTLEFPQRMDIEDDSKYTLRIRIEAQNGDGKSETYDLDIAADGHVISIKDVIFSPEGSVKAGRALLASVRLKNYGDKDEEGIKVRVNVPDLGISASDYIDELEEDESTTSEELYLRIPSCTMEGAYDVEVEVTYDDGDERVTEIEEIKVTSDETCGVSGVSTQKPTIIYDSSAQSMRVGGEGSIYALTISNPTSSAKTITIDVNGVEVFGNVKISPNNVLVLGAGETKTTYIYVNAAKTAKSGEYSFTATVSGLGESDQEIALTANVEKATSFASLKKGLEVGLVVLVVILVILGLIIGFNKLRSEEDLEEEGQTYY